MENDFFLSTVNDFLYIVRNTSIKMINPEQADRKKKKKKVYLLRKIAGEFKLCGDELLIPLASPPMSFYSHMLELCLKLISVRIAFMHNYRPIVDRQ